MFYLKTKRKGPYGTGQAYFTIKWPPQLQIHRTSHREVAQGAGVEFLRQNVVNTIRFGNPVVLMNISGAFRRQSQKHWFPCHDEHYQSIKKNLSRKVSRKNHRNFHTFSRCDWAAGKKIFEPSPFFLTPGKSQFSAILDFK